MTLNKRDKVMLSVLVLFVMVGGLYWFVVKPAKADVERHTQELAAIQSDVSALQDQLARLDAGRTDPRKMIADNFATVKAFPAQPNVASAMVQLQAIAGRTNVTFTSVSTSTVTDFGGLSAIELVITVRGRYFDVNDFMFRVHNLVKVDDGEQPVVKGRLFAMKSVDLDVESTKNDAKDARPNEIEGQLTTLIFTETPPPVEVNAAPESPGMASPRDAEKRTLDAVNATNNATNGGTP